MNESTQSAKSLESWIWDAACSIRGAKDAAKYKDFILPLIFSKRLCDVFDDDWLSNLIEAVSAKRLGLSDVEPDLIEGVIYLPENLFYNTPAPGIIIVLDRSEPKERRGKLFLLNASRDLHRARLRDGMEAAPQFTEGLRGEPQKRTEIGPAPESWEVVPLSNGVSIKNG